MNKVRSIEIILIAALTAFAAWLRFYKLGHLGLWGDEGFTYLSVEGILKHGYPLLPSGNAYFKDILFSYFSALPPLLFGLSEFTLRFSNAFFGVLLIPVFYLVGKRLFPAWIAFAGALILTLCHWEIEFARHARYYCQLQLFYLLSLYFFYSFFVDGKQKHQKWWLLFFVAACLTHQIAYTLVFVFVGLLWVKGFRRLWQKDVWLNFLIICLVIGVLQYLELFCWKVGSVTHLDSGKSLWHVLFREFHLGYFKQFRWLFPSMSLVALLGAAIFLFQRKHPLSFLMVVGICCLLFMGVGQAHFQPRYVFYLLPIFFYAYLACGSFLFVEVTKLCHRWPKFYVTGAVGILVCLLILGTVDGVNPHYAVRISKHKYGQRLIEKYQPSTTFRRRIDYKTAAEYVRTHAEPGDLVVGMHMVFQYIYAGRIDYWLWSAGRGAWDAYEESGTVPEDRYLGKPLIRDLDQFKALLKQSRGRRVWVITTPSWNDRGHIQPELAQYLTDHSDRIQYSSQDGISKVFLF